MNHGPEYPDCSLGTKWVIPVGADDEATFTLSELDADWTTAVFEIKHAPGPGGPWNSFEDPYTLSAPGSTPPIYCNGRGYLALVCTTVESSSATDVIRAEAETHST